jgi:hypothetical protein
MNKKILTTKTKTKLTTKLTMKNQINFLIVAMLTILTLSSCSNWNRPQPDEIGVLMENYGREGIKSFKVVTGGQGILLWDEELYRIPAWLQSGDPKEMSIVSKNVGSFYIDPAYTYKADRLRGNSLVYEYRNYAKDPTTFFENIEKMILDKKVTDAYREEARNYTTDSLMTNMNQFEKQVENRLRKDFSLLYFQLETITSGLKPDKSLVDEINRTNASLQRKKTIANDIENSKELQRKALIDAETDRIKSSGLTSAVLEEKWIDAIKSAKSVIVTDRGGHVIINPK